MTNFAFPKSDREQRGLRGPVMAFTEQYIPVATPAELAAYPADSPPPTPKPSEPYRVEFDRDGMQLGVNRERGPLTFDSSGRKMSVSPNNNRDGGTVTIYYDDHDRPVESEVRDSQGTLVRSEVQMYDQLGRITEEQEKVHHLPENVLSQIISQINSQINDEQAKELREYLDNFKHLETTQYFYDVQSTRVVRYVKRNPDQEVVEATTYNDHGDPELTLTTMTALTDQGKSYNGDVRYTYQYDSMGNWTERIVEGHSFPDGVLVHKSKSLRTIEYMVV